MASDVNSVAITGNLTREPELRATTGGMQILRFGMAVNDRRKTQSGEWEDVPNFIDCVTFGKRAEALAKLLSKGQKVAVSGQLRYSSWEKDGQKRSKIEVIAQEVVLLSQRSQQNAQQNTAPKAAPAPMQQPQPASVYDEDIPF